MGYALLLGASQQGITGLVDRQAQKVLNGISFEGQRVAAAANSPVGRRR
jgi:hypothetical protein